MPNLDAPTTNPVVAAASESAYSRASNQAIDRHPSKREWSLLPMQRLCAELGVRPEEFRSVHVAGSNGKGSVVAMVSAVLREAGLKVGTYTSPHLLDARERIAVNGEKIPEKKFAELNSLVEAASAKISPLPSFFERVTATAFLYFGQQKVDLVVAEVGLGGRLDATNLLQPLVAVVTNASLEHTDLLGGSVREIAFEKAGIVKRGCEVVTAAEGEALEAVRKKCVQENSRLFEIGDKNLGGIECTPEKTCFSFENNPYCTRLLGRHQATNAALAVKAVRLLGEKNFVVDEKAIVQGLEAVELRGRLEIIARKPLLVLDGAHNPAAASVLAQAVNELWPGKKVLLVAGILADKDVEGILGGLSAMRVEKFFACAPASERALLTNELAEKAGKFFGKEKTFVCGAVGEAVPSVRNSVTRAAEKTGAERGDDEMIVVTGSLYTVGEALKALGEKQ